MHLFHVEEYQFVEVEVEEEEICTDCLSTLEDRQEQWKNTIPNHL